MHISSSYANILGETNFRTREIPRSGSKAKDAKEKKGKRPKVGDNNGQATYGARKHSWRTQAAWANKSCQTHFSYELITMTKTAALGPGSLQLILN